MGSVGWGESQIERWWQSSLTHLIEWQWSFWAHPVAAVMGVPRVTTMRSCKQGNWDTAGPPQGEDVEVGGEVPCVVKGMYQDPMLGSFLV